MFDSWHPWSGLLVDVGLPPAPSESAVEALLFMRLRSAVLAVWADPSWMGQRFRADVAAVLGLRAGPALMCRLAELGRGPCPAGHGDDGPPIAGQPRYGSPGNPCLCLLAAAAAWQACLGYTSAQARGAVVDAAGVEPLVLPRQGNRPQIVDPAREQLATVLRLSPGSAGVRIEQARNLAVQRCIADLVAQGVLPEAPAVRISAGLSRLEATDTAACGAELSCRVRGRIARGLRPWTGADAAHCARRLAVKTRSHQSARRRAVAARSVTRWSNGDGTATFSAVLPELAAERMYRRLTAIAHGMDQDPRTMDARRADLLADLVLGAAHTQPSGVELNVIIDAPALFGLTDGVAQVPGMGPIPGGAGPGAGRDARWRAWIRDAAGTITATGTTTYTPTAAIARLVRAQQPRCRMPGCRRPASLCDLDHAIPWPDGPTTVRISDPYAVDITT